MSFSGFSLNGGVHPCLPFYERMLTCARAETLPIKVCTAQTEDYLECVHRKKQINFQNKDITVLCDHRKSSEHINQQIKHFKTQFEILSGKLIRNNLLFQDIFQNSKKILFFVIEDNQKE